MPRRLSLSKNSLLSSKAPSKRELSPPKAVTEGVKQRINITFCFKTPPSRLRRAPLLEGGFLGNLERLSFSFPGISLAQ